MQIKKANIFSDFQIMRILSGPIEEVRALDEFRSERMLAPMHLEIVSERFWEEFVLLETSFISSKIVD